LGVRRGTHVRKCADRAAQILERVDDGAGAIDCDEGAIDLVDDTECDAAVGYGDRPIDVDGSAPAPLERPCC
jgi:hypothetical protein